MPNKFSGLPLPLSHLILAMVGFSACAGETDVGTSLGSSLMGLCEELKPDLVTGAIKDGIPALTDPELVSAGHPEADYLLGSDRVIGLEIAGEYVAIPHNILWWHEIVNFNDAGLAVTYCPLTGSSMVFDRGAAEGAEFGVSGFLFNNNLVMYDRAPSGVVESLWPQMLASGRCGPGEGRKLDMVPALEIEWEDWVALHPDTRVVSGDTGFSGNYTRYPYGDYEVESNALTLVPLDEVDSRRPPKERVLGIPFAHGGGLAFPFGALRDLGDLGAIHEIGEAQKPIVVFWDNEASAAMAYRPTAGGQALTFEVSGGAFVDMETGSEWSLEGKALSGPLSGQRLAMIPNAYVSFWFAFTTFFENSDLWLPSGRLKQRPRIDG